MLENPQTGAKVRVLEPFDHAFPEVYTVKTVTAYPDGQCACDLEEVEGAFDPKFLIEAGA